MDVSDFEREGFESALAFVKGQMSALDAVSRMIAAREARDAAYNAAWWAECDAEDARQDAARLRRQEKNATRRANEDKDGHSGV